MTLQTFLIVQLGVLALGLGAAMGWRGWQMRRQMTLLTESIANLKVESPPTAAMPTSEQGSDEPPQTSVEATTEIASQDDDNPESEPESEQEKEKEPEQEQEAKLSADNDTSVEPDESAAQAEDQAGSEFDDLDELLTMNDTPEETNEETSEETKDEAKDETPEVSTEEIAQEKTEETTAATTEATGAETGEETTTEAENSPPATPPAQTPAAGDEPEQNGLRALVTKFAAENRQLLEQVHTLEEQVQQLEAQAAQTTETEAG